MTEIPQAGTVVEVAPDADPLAELEALERGDAGEGTPEQGQPTESQPAGGEEQTPEGEPAGQPDDLIEGRFRSVDELRSSWREQQQMIGRQSNELGELRRRVDEISQSFQPSQQQPYAAQPQPQSQQQQPGYAGQQLPVLSPEQLEELNAVNPLAAQNYIAAMQAQQVRDQVIAEVTGQFGPLLGSVVDAQTKAEAASSIERLKQDFGDETILRYQNQIAEELDRDEGYFIDPQTRYQRLRQVVALQILENEGQGALPAGRTTADEQHRDPATGRFVAGGVQGGSTGHVPAPAAAGQQQQPADPDLGDWDRIGDERDAFGRKPIDAMKRAAASAVVG